MNLPAVSTDKNLEEGFTLIEIIVVVAIVAIIGGLSLVFGLGNFRTQTFHANRETLISALQHARSMAVSNICRGDDCEDGEPHGILIDPEGKQFVVFQGEDFVEDSSNNVYLEANSNVTYSGAQKVVFGRLSGEVIRIDDDADLGYEEGPWEIILTDQITGRAATLEINIEGQIEWKD